MRDQAISLPDGLIGLRRNRREAVFLYAVQSFCMRQCCGA